MLIRANSERIKELDGIRGVACILVLIHHYFTGAFTFTLTGIPHFLLSIFSTFFLSGVDLFFVLSGFLVGGIIIDNVSSPNFLKVFFIRRACRIFPIYFALIGSLAVGLLFLKDVGFFKEWLLKHPYPIWPYLTFLQSYTFGIGNNSGPIWAAVTWSVSVEEQFYFLMPFIFLLLGIRQAFMVMACCLIAAPFIRLYLMQDLGFYAAYMFFPARMDTIFWGVFLAFVLRSEKWRSVFSNNTPAVLTVTAVVFVIITSGLLTGNVFLKYSFLAIFYTLILWLVMEQKISIINKFLHWRFLTFTGFISYAVYMFHQLINGLMHGFWFNSKPIIDSWDRVAITCVSLVIVYLLSYLSLRFFELPIRNFGAKFTYSPTHTAAQVDHNQTQDPTSIPVKRAEY